MAQKWRRRVVRPPVVEKCQRAAAPDVDIAIPVGTRTDRAGFGGDLQISAVARREKPVRAGIARAIGAHGSTWQRANHPEAHDQRHQQTGPSPHRPAPDEKDRRSRTAQAAVAEFGGAQRAGSPARNDPGGECTHLLQPEQACRLAPGPGRRLAGCGNRGLTSDRLGSEGGRQAGIRMLPCSRAESCRRINLCRAHWGPIRPPARLARCVCGPGCTERAQFRYLLQLLGLGDHPSRPPPAPAA